MNARILIGALALLVAGQVAPSLAYEMGDNPEYKSWASFKAGSMVTLKMISDAGGNKTEMTNTMELLEISGDKAVIQTTTVMVVAGNEMKMPPQKREIMAKMKMAEPAANTKEGPKAKESSEDVTVEGTTYKCKVTESTNEANGVKSVAKSWTSDEVPGGLVKMESTSSGAMSAKTSLTLVKAKAVK